MEPGREIDALVAEKVMGWERTNISMFDEEGVEGTLFTSPEGVEYTAYGQGSACEYSTLVKIPHYSTDIAAAWQVVEKLHTRGYDVLIRRYQTHWFCSAWKEGVEGYQKNEQNVDTAPHAICLAALKAVGAL